MMKKWLYAITIALSAGTAHADIVSQFSLSSSGPVAFSGDSHDVISGATGGVFGQLSATQDTTLNLTFLGYEAASINSFYINGSEVAGSSTGTVGVGDTFSFNVAAGLVDFGFGDSGGTASASNLNNFIGQIAYIDNDGSYTDAAGNPYAFLIGFNDGGSEDGDYDDYVVGVSGGVSAVPVPAALPLMASALAIFGIARRRNSLT